MKNISPILLITSIVVLVSFFIILSFLSQKTSSKYEEVTFKTSIDTVMVIDNEFLGAGRGAIAYSKDRYVYSAAKLIENKSGFSSWKSNGPIIDFDTIPHIYTLGDLGFPFKIFKEAYSDTLYVLKNGRILRFLLVKYE